MQRAQSRNGLLKFRRSWWELQKGAEKYRKEGMEKWWRIRNKDPDFARACMKLPRGFICYWFKDGLRIEDKMRFLLAQGWARVDGGFEYDMLELEHIILSKSKRLSWIHIR